MGDKPHLDEANVLGILPEALSADVEAILTDQTPVISAHSAAAQHSTTFQNWTTIPAIYIKSEGENFSKAYIFEMH